MTAIKGLGRVDFERRFGTEEQCMAHLAKQKWDIGFLCKAYGQHSAFKGKR